MRIIVSLVAVALLASTSVYAKKPEHAGQGKKEKKQKQHKKKHQQQVKSFSTGERSTIQNYYRNLPPGLQKKLRRTGELPPGWEKKVNVGKPLPQEYITIAKPIPYELEAQLPAGPIGSKLLQIADRVVRVEAGTNMVIEALKF